MAGATDTARDDEHVNFASLIPLLGAAAVALSALGTLLQRWDRASRIKRMTTLADTVPDGPGRLALVEARDVLAVRHGLATSYMAPSLPSTLRTFCLFFGLLITAAVALTSVAASPWAPDWLDAKALGTVSSTYQTLANWLLFGGAAIQGALIGNRRVWIRDQLSERLKRPRASGWRAFFE